MCGICGVVQLGGSPREVVEADRLDAMTDAMTHRGPDDRGIYRAPGIAMGVRRLSIVDVAGGHQPVRSEDSTVIAAQNGELYNHLELRTALERGGHRLKSRCDTEILPHLYEVHGSSFVDLLRGKFGLVVWDERARRAVLARDRLGVKPLYWATCGDLLVFASELKSLLASGLVTVTVDPSAVDAYLTLGYVPAPRTVLMGVNKLLPGHRLVVEGGDASVERYWRFPPPRPDYPARRLDEYAEEAGELLQEAVRLRLMSDVPLGAMLSGGLDSSLVVALMARELDSPVQTFSVGFREDGRNNELADARRVARMFGCEHHELELSLSDADIDLDDLVWCLDEPVAELSALGFLQLSRLASRHVTVALSGQGADELFGGYRKHRVAAVLNRLDRLPPIARRLLGRPLSYAPDRWARLAPLLATDDPVQRQLAMSGQLDAPTRRRLYRNALAGIDSTHASLAPMLDGVSSDALSTTLFLDAQLALVDNMLHYFDRMSMAASIEVRVPFLDHQLVEWSATLPPSARVSGVTTKAVLKRLAQGLVPDDIIEKRKIGFFRNSGEIWLRRQIEAGEADRLVVKDGPLADILDIDVIGSFVETYQRRPGWEGTQLLIALVVLERWLASFVPRATAIAPMGRAA